MDIKEIAKTMNREEFIEEASKSYSDKLNQSVTCPYEYNLNIERKCCIWSSRCKKCWKEAVKDIKFKDDMEGNKVEDKIIKVRCITDKWEGITLNKFYKVLNEQQGFYNILDDKEEESIYEIHLFEEVKEDILMVECVDNFKGGYDLTINKKYEIIEEYKNDYLINNDKKEDVFYPSTLFKPVPKEKEVKEYKVMELLEFEEGTRFKSMRQGQIVKVVVIGDNKYLQGESSGANLYMTSNLLKQRFTKVEEPKPVSTVEAFKALDEGKTIISVLSNNQYKKYSKDIFASTIGCNEFHKCDLIYTNEMTNKWLVIE